MDIELDQDIAPETQTKKNDKGFTLIELLIVIVILGVLSTVVVLSVGGITNRGKESACSSDYNALATAVETYNADTGAFPVGATNAARMTVLTAGGYLRTPSTKYAITDDSGDVDSAVAECNGIDPDGK
jgi:general secretion pathway protein G